MNSRTLSRPLSGRLRSPLTAGVAASVAVVLTAGAVPASAVAGPAESTDTDVLLDAAYDEIELQARSNLPVNDDGYNLPLGSLFNSITPDINDTGDVTFRVQLVPTEADPSVYQPGLWLGGHGAGDVVWTGAAGSLIDTDATINNPGNVAFTTSAGGFGNSLYRYDAATATATQVGSAPVFPQSYQSPSIIQGDDIGFQANHSQGRSFAAVRGGSGVLYASDNVVDPASAYSYLYTPATNEAGQIAGKVATSDDLTTKVEIRRFEADGTSTLILANQATDPSSPYTRFDNSLALADDGTVAVVATRTDGARVVVRSDGVTTTELAMAEPAGTIRSLEFFRPSINDAGQVAFRGTDANGQAVYVADGTSLTRIVGKGDVLQTDLGSGAVGQHDSSPAFGGAPTINEAGDVVFTAAVHPEGNNQVEWGTGVFVAYSGLGEPAYSTAVNVGGGEYVDAAGLTWQEDQAYVPGSWGYVGKTKAESTRKDIAGTDADPLFQDRRSGIAAYRFDAVPAGTYEIELDFAEFQQKYREGRRVVTVSVGGSAVLPDHDIAADVGGQAADAHTVTVEHGGGDLVVDFASAGKTKPVLNAISIAGQ